MLQLPSYFCLQDITAITGRVFELKYNPFQQAANEASERWLRSFSIYRGKDLTHFLSYRFDEFAAMSFPDADEAHLETCINLLYWTFSFDDLSDEGEYQRQPDCHQIGVDKCLRVLEGTDANVADFTYASMLTGIWKHLNETATPGACARFARAVERWCISQVQQSANRLVNKVLSVADFIVMRRHTFGADMAGAIVEYSLELDLPDHVFADPVVIAMSEAASDIMIWPNDICSFNKEQADGDDQNLVYCVMVERNVDLQTAIDIVTEMLRDRVSEYENLKRQLRSFGPEVDREFSRYLKGLEHFVQGMVVWYYSPRYFRGLDISDRRDLIVPVLAPKVKAVE